MVDANNCLLNFTWQKTLCISIINGVSFTTRKPSPPPKKRRDELDNVAMNIKFKRENNM